MERTPEELARHESGHAVLAHVLGYPITLVSVARGKARCEADFGSDDIAQEHAIEGTNRMIRYFLGGVAADTRYPLAHANGRYCLLGWGRDMVYARELAKVNASNLRLSDIQIIEKQLRKALRIVATHWPAATTLVRELLDRTELPGDEVHALIDRELHR